MTEDQRTKLTARTIAARKHGAKLSMLTAYDFPTARLIEQAGVEIILVGDSLGMGFQGQSSTIPVTVDDIVYHTRVVVRGAPHTFIVADLPFLSYHASDEQALKNAGRLLQEGGADAVKLEGGVTIAPRIQALVAAGIPVMAHIGLGPQSVGTMGGFRIQGRSLESAKLVIEDAKSIAAAGAFSVVVELVPAEVTRIITERLAIPTIGIGAGPHCDGQVLVTPDVIGLDDRYAFKFVRRYADVGKQMRDAFASFAADVASGSFPDISESHTLKPDVAHELEVLERGA